MRLTTPRRLVALATGLIVAAAVLGSPGSSAGAPAAAAGPAERADGPLFAALPDFELPASDRVRVRPDEFAAFDVRVTGVADRLAGAPGPWVAGRGAEPATVTLPDPDGAPVRFALERARVAERGFEAAHPELRTWTGRAVGEPATRIALDVTPMGLHAFVRRPGSGRSWLIDPAENRRGATEHLSYYGRDLDAAPVDLLPPLPAGSTRSHAPAAQARTAPGAAVALRTFRLALVTDPAYADFFGSANVAAEKVTLVNRINQIYNDDHAVRMLLVDATDDLNLDTAAKATGPDGPCGANGCYAPEELEACSPDTIARNTFVIGQVIGADNYDIGHLSLGVNGGGIARIAVVGDELKAEGCTGLPFPTGDFYAIDYVAHEMGHQFAADHTFNGNQGNCSLANRNPGTSVEPGSGSSVMAYAGICGRDDLQPHTDPYFSQRSQDQVDGHVTDTILLFDEVQTIALSDWDAAGDTIRLTYPGRTPVEVDFGSADYSALGLQEKVRQLTGFQPDVRGYDGAPLPTGDGFELTFNTLSGGGGGDVARIGVENAGGDVSGSTGVQVQGGPGTNRGFATTTPNHAPSVIAPTDRTLPVRTPFALTGQGSDPDGDPLVYLWEQDDEGVDPIEGDALLENTKTDGPLFRVFPSAADVSLADSLEYESDGQNTAGTNPTRTFPDLRQVLAGDTNADTGACPDPPGDPDAPVPAEVRACYAEFLPTSDYVGDPAGEGRVLSFRLTARDQRPGGGGTAFDDVTLRLDPTAGPLRVDSQAVPGATRAAGSTEEITWEVNGTDAAGLAPTVRITLSEDGGDTFPYVLAGSTPNDGSARITWPQIFSDEVRLKVEAVDNYFFDVNDADLSVVSSLVVTADSGTASAAFSDDLDTPVEITARTGRVDADELAISVAGLPGLRVVDAETTADGVRPSVATFLLDGPIAADPGDRVAEVRVSEPGATGAEADAAILVTVRPETAVVTWTGPDETPVDAPVTLSARVEDPEDGSPGDVTRSRVSFVDRDDGNALICAADVTGTSARGAASCEARFDTAGEHAIGLVLTGAHASDDADDDVTLTVVADDGTPPQTRITSGPFELLPSSVATVRYAADEEATFECSLDDDAVACAGDRVRLRGLVAGMHRFVVQAVDAAGHRDPTPAQRRFAVAHDDRQLRRHGAWNARTHRNAFRGTYLETFRFGPRVALDVRRGNRIGLVVGTGRNFGKIDVFVAGRRVRTVDLEGPWRLRKLIVLPRMPITSGRYAIRSRGGGRVRIDGLAVFRP